MNDPIRQRQICMRFGAAFVQSEPSAKVGIALGTLNQLPLNALRHKPEADTCGWYIWGGEVLSDAPDFFQPLHVEHLSNICAGIVPYLGLEPGWRVLLAPHQEDVWFDPALLGESGASANGSCNDN